MKNNFEAQRRLLKRMSEGGPGSGRRPGYGGVDRGWQKRALQRIADKEKLYGPRPNPAHASPPRGTPQGDVNYAGASTPAQDRRGKDYISPARAARYAKQDRLRKASDNAIKRGGGADGAGARIAKARDIRAKRGLKRQFADLVVGHGDKKRAANHQRKRPYAKDVRKNWRGETPPWLA